MNAQMHINSIYVQNHISLSLPIQMNHIPLSKSEKMKCGYLTKAVCLTLDGLPNTVTAQITPVFYERREPQKLNDDSSIDQSITDLIHFDENST